MSLIQKIYARYSVAICAGFDETKLKFIKQGASESEIQRYFDAFKKLKSQNKIKQDKDKDIDTWGKRSFSDFKTYINNATNQKSNKEIRVEHKQGADQIAENDNWYAFKINTFNAARYYGQKTIWCLAHDEKMWNVLNYSSSFYFIIAKRPSKELIIDGFDYTKICVEFFSDRPAQPQDSFACNVANKHADEHNYDDLTFLDLPHFKHVPETIKKITPSNIEEALATPKFAVQLAAVQSGLMTKEQIKKLINGHYLDLIKKNFSDTYAERVSHNYESLVVKAESIYF